jgi:hypothetical protein
MSTILVVLKSASFYRTRRATVTTFPAMHDSWLANRRPLRRFTQRELSENWSR